MYNKELYDLISEILDNNKTFLENNEVQLRFNDLTTKKFNELIDYIFALEKRIEELEDKILYYNIED